MDSISIVWFRLDLRLADNLALLAAASDSRYVVPVYVWNGAEEGSWAPGAASRWWLHQSLEQLNSELEKSGSRLVIRAGDSREVLRDLVKESGARSVFWNRRFDPNGRAQDREIESALKDDGVAVAAFNSSLLHEPEIVRSRQGGPFRVFTPFWNHFCSTIDPAPPVEKPEVIAFPRKKIDSLTLESLALEPDIDWTSGFRETWTPGEHGAQARLKRFINHGLMHYTAGRDRPDHDGVSMLSPHLHFGEIGPRQIWHAAKQARGQSPERKGVETYLKEIGWREFAHHVLYHFPHTADRPLRPDFERFLWSEEGEPLRRWQEGLTGYPIVDAGMRQLWHCGWMHNRVRMIVASFLTKDLLISWTHGAKWFWDTLVDADLANNTLGWQWAAGCGADAAPYFRIFNPELQGEKFDPQGDYVRRWVPEVAQLPAKWIHSPWRAPAQVLLSANVELGRTYPKPVVDHAWARKRALDALSRVKKSADPSAICCE